MIQSILANKKLIMEIILLDMVRAEMPSCIQAVEILRRQLEDEFEEMIDVYNESSSEKSEGYEETTNTSQVDLENQEEFNREIRNLLAEQKGRGRKKVSFDDDTLNRIYLYLANGLSVSGITKKLKDMGITYATEHLVRCAVFLK